MSSKTVAPYGSWESPLSAKSLDDYSGARGDYSDMTYESSTNKLYYLKSNGDGTTSVVSRKLEAKSEETSVVKPPFNCATRAHEYGGGAFIVSKNTLYFSNAVDFRVYKLDLSDSYASPVAITQESGKKFRYADFAAHPTLPYLVAVREVHDPVDCKPNEVKNHLVTIRLSDGKEDVLCQGADFYSYPAFSPVDPTKIAYVSWNFPSMPWDFTLLDVATVAVESDQLVLKSTEKVAGYDQKESVMQPEWSLDGKHLFFAGDRSGWWNLQKYHLDAKKVETVLEKPIDAEFSGPAWQFNQRYYAVISADQIAAVYVVNGDSKLGLISISSRSLTEIKNQFTVIHDFKFCKDSKVVFVGGCPTRTDAFVSVDLKSQETLVLAQKPLGGALTDENISVPENISFPTENGKTSYAYFYPPKNAKFAGPEGQLPPLRVLLHGGPSANTVSSFRAEIQYWTSRGFAVADVNYGGSTGYGTEFRQRLNGQWGIVDVDDCCNVVKYLASQKRVNGDQTCIKGGSAGGYTVLACLAFKNVFKAGCSLYGVSDITSLALDTHKFESRYLDIIIAPYPEGADVYAKRSPINSADKISCPCIFFQGLDDAVVPPNQSEMMVETLKKLGIPVAYVAYPGEGHGFRKTENQVRTIELELWFYSQMWKFTLAEKIEGVEITNKK